ncbi:phosphoglycerate mutase-like protein [Lojkania enalia]|uniref:Phosphoglycerate mutase-like protein n=1 Tax=Lojkania enalia TaxID=147567 RepID=A0A9P4N097_9PLEO|nr:phosphoglycerate mutase-like protein [Didymosphaeria enalia]
MQNSLLPLLLSLLATAEAAETVLGAYIFHRHGDRTPKALAPANLTTLGYEQVYNSGQYYRSRYLDSSSASNIHGINEDIVNLQQLSVTAPVDNILQNSAMGFLQGLYPPVGESIGVQTLANGTDVQAPMNGYQLIPINTVSTGSGSEDNGWLQDATGCYNAKLSSNNYFSSAEYENLLSSTQDFYDSLLPVVNATLDTEDVSFKNAYIVYDLIHVATIHNHTIRSSSLLTPSTLLRLRTLADAHEWGLAYNASDDMRAIAGMQLAGEILKYMNSTIASASPSSINNSNNNKLGIQFGAYATFMSFFGLAGLQNATPDFQGIVQYASSMVFELFTESDVEKNGFPGTEDLKVRFLFHNGTAGNASEPTVYPLFGGEAEAVSWSDFAEQMTRFEVSTTGEWCTKCGNSTGMCAQYASNDSSTTEQSGGGHGMSAAVGGVIGAFVMVGVVLMVLAAVVVLGGVRFATKKRLAGNSGGLPVTETGKTG